MKSDKRGYGGHDTTYSIRCMKTLIQQIEEDYRECKQLWKLLESGTIKHDELEELLRVMAWLREDMDTLRGLQAESIEGVFGGDMGHIEREVRDREEYLRYIIYAGRLERERIERI